MNEPKQWRMEVGIHKGTVTSRDIRTDFEVKNLEDCKTQLAAYEKDMQFIGYQIWYAKAYHPDGTEIKLHPGTSYR